MGFDIATVSGIFAAFGLVFAAIALGGGFSSFLDGQSFLIVAGGTLGATLVAFPMDDFMRTFTVLRQALYPQARCALERIYKIVEFARISRAEGDLSLERYCQNEGDSFLKKCLELLVDHTSIDEMRRILQIEVSIQEDRHRRGAQLFHTMGAIAPAMGLIGTLIGLVRMLENLNNPEAIGPAMSVAIITTFYGALLAYVLFNPLAAKLRMRSEEERLINDLTIEGIICISQNINPRMIEERLQGFLPPHERL